MGTTALASVSDLEARGVDVSDPTRAQSAIDDASNRIHLWTGNAWIDDTGELVDNIPGIAKTICCAAARRALENPLGVTQESTGLGTFSETRSFANASPDVFLTRSEKRDLDRALGRTSLGVVRLSAPFAPPPAYPGGGRE